MKVWIGWARSGCRGSPLGCATGMPSMKVRPCWTALTPRITSAAVRKFREPISSSGPQRPSSWARSAGARRNRSLNCSPWHAPFLRVTRPGRHGPTRGAVDGRFARPQRPRHPWLSRRRRLRRNASPRPLGSPHRMRYSRFPLRRLCYAGPVESMNVRSFSHWRQHASSVRPCQASTRQRPLPDVTAKRFTAGLKAPRSPGGRRSAESPARAGLPAIPRLGPSPTASRPGGERPSPPRSWPLCIQPLPSSAGRETSRRTRPSPSRTPRTRSRRTHSSALPLDGTKG